MSKREDTSEDDSVTLYLDTFRDGQRAYYFSTNPLGVQSDGIYSDGRHDGLFDTLWYSKGRITPDGRCRHSCRFRSGACGIRV